MFSEAKDSWLLQSALLKLYDGAHGDPEKLKKLERALRRPERLYARAGKALASAAHDHAPEIFQKLKAAGPEMLAGRRAMFTGFEHGLYEAWKRPLDLLEMLIVASTEAAEGVSAQWKWKDRSQDLVFDMVRRLHVRACQVAHEILTLLKAGYAPAAHARWRTLHETVATAQFIAKHGVKAAELYRDHEHMEAKKASRQYQRYARRLGYEKYSPREMASFRRKYARRLQKYGPAFKGDYGWAAVTLSKKGATFADVEKDVKLDHWRPFYKMASHPVHAGIKAIRFSLAVDPEAGVLLAGPSMLGLTDPGHSAAISLTQLTTTLLLFVASSDSISVGRVLQLFVDEIGEAFIEAQRALKRAGRSRPRRSGAKRKQTP